MTGSRPTPSSLDGAGVVVTGGGGGIGAAMARRFAAEGARVVVADLNGDAVTTVAEEIGGTAVTGDVASEAGVAELLGAARDALGEIDLFCANAGVAPLGGADAAEQQWALAWDVNVMAHVRAASALLPDWLARGRGHFIATVSAAGLLTSLGSAPYSVTKHGALAFAEWLSATYRHRGITVQAVCPQGVRTRMLEDAGPGGKLLMDESAISAERVADLVVESVADGRFLVLPHPEVADYYAARATQTERWLGGMNKLQRKIEDALGTT
ncbi:NADP-dependent 3-hydroxy acid dehydrogenase YdfG [Amycolatopsis marina]|uniref:NADP-dependent 3-hydroxy acid dehydrogenase YdfG n=1 Tax=Amycolatopsis marina TaxID=490629 RepID=A0A1I0Z3S6_9PSEU|nr:SDR family oxidoreductase [Amycolatopsis marina]SFB20264.1 NADP-dependent 3-hydroxy acid dehydrogenase YdfG [Amycolatopsis marina]